eukprot:m.360013 g.360013  ORF g.360013 m.360013 type:complete len:761 (+) comp18854_c0_seq1:100-2382(+)
MARAATDAEQRKFHFLNVNQDSTCLVACTRDGFGVFNLNPLELKQLRSVTSQRSHQTDRRSRGSSSSSSSKSFSGAATSSTQSARSHASFATSSSTTSRRGILVAKACMLFRCNYLALVGGGGSQQFAQNKVIIWNDSTATIVSELEFKSEVKTVQLRRDRLVVVCETQLMVYAFTAQPRRLYQVDTCSNPRGVCALSSAEKPALVAFPGSQPGHLHLLDIATGNMTTPPTTIAAHEAPLAAITISNNGRLVATASERGTLVRVFDCNSGRKVREFRRGTEPAYINSIAFNSDNTFCAVSSNHGTVHVFSLALNMQAASGFLPKYFTSPRSVAKLTMPGTDCICLFPSRDTIAAVGTDGLYRCSRFTNDGLVDGIMQQSLLTLHKSPAMPRKTVQRQKKLPGTSSPSEPRKSSSPFQMQMQQQQKAEALHQPTYPSGSLGSLRSFGSLGADHGPSSTNAFSTHSIADSTALSMPRTPDSPRDFHRATSIDDRVTVFASVPASFSLSSESDAPASADRLSLHYLQPNPFDSALVTVSKDPSPSHSQTHSQTDSPTRSQTHSQTASSPRSPTHSPILSQEAPAPSRCSPPSRPTTKPRDAPSPMSDQFQSVLVLQDTPRSPSSLAPGSESSVTPASGLESNAGNVHHAQSIAALNGLCTPHTNVELAESCDQGTSIPPRLLSPSQPEDGMVSSTNSFTTTFAPLPSDQPDSSSSTSTASSSPAFSSSTSSTVSFSRSPMSNSSSPTLLTATATTTTTTDDVD